MTFLGIQQEIYDRIGLSQTPSAGDVRRIKSFLNRWHRRVLSARGMSSLRRVVVPQASVANQATYGIVLDKILWVTESTTQRRLTEKSLGWYRDVSPDPSAFTGTPDYYILMGRSRIHTLPANASELFVKSSQAADTGTVKVEAIRSTGYRVSLSVALTGTTAVSMNTAITDVIDIVDVYVSAAQTGVVTLHEDSGTGAELSRIPIGATYPRFLRYALAPRPVSAITYQIDGIADIVDIANDTDEPLMGPDWHDILVDGTVYEEWRTKGRAADAREILNGGNLQRPTDNSIEGRIRQLRASLVDWSEETPQGEEPTFDETITLPIT